MGGNASTLASRTALSTIKPSSSSSSSSKSSTSTHRRINARTLTAPAAAFTMALLLFVYTRTSIRAAKANAKRHRDADGGQGLDLLNESRRRHGLLDRPDQGVVGGLASQAREQLLGKKRGKKGDGGGKDGGDGVVDGPGRSEEEGRLRAALSKRREGE